MPPKSRAKKKLSPGQRTDLDVQIGFMEALVRRDPHYIEALQILGDDYTLRGKPKAGLRIDERLARLRPEDPMVQYNLACSYTLTGSHDRAVAALEKAISLGYRDFKWLARDPDLSSLRQHPLYKIIRAKVRQMKSVQT